MLQERETGDLDFAFRPSLVKRHFEELKSFGASDQEAYLQTYDFCRRDLTYYFLEQFAKKKLVSYEYRFEEDANKGKQMISPHYQQGDFCEQLAKPVYERKSAGLDFSRETAELEGMERVKQELVGSDRDAAVILISRPPEEEGKRVGYGDYSFVYFGHFNPEEGRLSMYAWRNNMSLEEHNALYREFGGEETLQKVDSNDFLRSPLFKFGDEAHDACDRLMTAAGREVADFYEYREEVDRAAKVLVDMAASGASDRLMNLAQQDIELEFVKFIEGGEQIKPVFESKIESFSTEQEAFFYVSSKKQEFGRMYDLTSYSGGNCGRSAFASGGLSVRGGASLLARSVMPDLMVPTADLSDYFTCPKCEGKIESGRGTTTCPHCGFTKEQAASEMGIAC